MSFSTLLQRFKDGFGAPAEPGARRHAPIQLAMAAVLLEIAYADGGLNPAEDGDIIAYLQKAFSLDEDSVRELIRAADDIRANTIDHFALTNYIRQNTSVDERREMVKMMWRIGYADGKLSEYENYLVRKIADLLRIEHRDVIDAKVAVLAERGEAE